MAKGLQGLFKKQGTAPFVSVDIGTSAIKVMSLDLSGARPKLLGLGTTPTPANVINNNTVVKVEQVGAAIVALMEANGIAGRQATLSIPGPAVFSKKVTIGYSSAKNLKTNISFEAGSYIPHSIEAVHLDYQVLKVNGSSSLDVLLVAVKNEIINSYVHAVKSAGLEPAIADVDYFAIENMFELNYPEEKNKTVALVNIGARYSSVSILGDGKPLFTGDVGVGGRIYTDALCETLGMQPAQAEKAKTGTVPDGFDEHMINETLDRTTEHVASELHRQIGFFWNAAGTDRGIETIYICGGGSRISGLIEEISAKAGTPCLALEPFRHVDLDSRFDKDLIEQVKASMGVSVGLASRALGDKPQMVH